MEKIVVLKGAERVRRRPAVIFGSDDLEGVKKAFDNMLDVFKEACARGYGDRIKVTLDADHTVEIEKNGRGLYFGDGDAIWQELFCMLFASGQLGADKRSAFDAPAGEAEIAEALDLCAVQCASAYMDVCSVREGVEYKLHFEKGENVGGLKKAPCDEVDGLRIRFKPDPLVFTDTALPAAYIEQQLQVAALALPGVTVAFGDKQFVYQDIADYLTGEPCFTVSLTAEGQERYNKPRYTAKMKVALCFVKEGGFAKCIHNGKECACGGAHLDGIVDEIWRYAQWDLNSKLTKKALLKHLQLLLITEAPVTVWTNATQTRIQNILLRDMAADTIDDNFRLYLKENKEYIKTIMK